MNSINEIQINIVNNLSDLIRIKMKQLETEQKYPGNDLDKMEDNLSLLTKQTKRLLKLRTEFEFIMADITLN